MKLNIDDIEITEKIQNFKQYLETTDRIILSARFGDGKTYFLDKIRNDEELKNQYEFFTIYPVNYSAATNEDIFEYIKRDIIIQIKERGVLDDIDYKALYGLIKNFFDFSEVINFVLSLDPRLEFCQKIFEKVTPILREGKKEYDKRKQTVEQYLATFNKIGSIYENDGYTALIKEGLEWIKGNKDVRNNKKTVLIIEDLDRLDPGHLFRILNVLSAHIDDTSRPDLVKNKFGFHNIVIVMDYEATKHIFRHFYGEGANFEGYICKFLSREPIRYSIITEMRRKIKEELSDQLGVQKLFDNFVNFNAKLDSFSLRDLKRLSDFETTDKNIRNENIGLYGKQLSSNLPFFHIISYMIEAGMNSVEIVKDLILDPNKKYDEQILIEHLRLLYPMYIVNQDQIIDRCTIHSKSFMIETQLDEKGNIIATIIKSIKKGSNEFLELDDLDEIHFTWHLENTFSKIINLSALSIQ